MFINSNLHVFHRGNAIYIKKCKAECRIKSAGAIPTLFRDRSLVSKPSVQKEGALIYACLRSPVSTCI